MTPVVMPRQRKWVGATGLTAAKAQPCIKSTLYDVMTCLQTVVDPTEDDMVVAIVVEWLRSGRITLAGRPTVAA
jgi:hypothetical protein